MERSWAWLHKKVLPASDLNSPVALIILCYWYCDWLLSVVSCDMKFLKQWMHDAGISAAFSELRKRQRLPRPFAFFSAPFHCCVGVVEVHPWVFNALYCQFNCSMIGWSLYNVASNVWNVFDVPLFRGLAQATMPRAHSAQREGGCGHRLHGAAGRSCSCQSAGLLSMSRLITVL